MSNSISNPDDGHDCASLGTQTYTTQRHAWPHGGCVVDKLETSCGNAMSHLNLGTGDSTSVIGNSSTTMQDIIHSVMSSLTPELMFTPAGRSITHINVSGLEGTPGHETIEWQWVSYGGQTVYVPVPTAYSGVLSMPGSIVPLASSIFPQNPIRQIYSPKDLKGTVTALVSGDCATFLERLYRTVAGMNRQSAPQSKDFNILDVFNSVTSRPGAIVITPDLRSSSGRPIGGTISGTLGDSANPATIELNAYTYYGTLPEAGRNFAEYSYAIRAIHESFHFAAKGGGYGDFDLAEAVSVMTKKSVPEGDVFVKSGFWNAELLRRCPEIRR